MPGPFPSPESPKVVESVNVHPAAHLCPSSAGASAPFCCVCGAAGKAGPRGVSSVQGYPRRHPCTCKYKETHRTEIRLAPGLDLLGAQGWRPFTAWTQTEPESLFLANKIVFRKLLLIANLRNIISKRWNQRKSNVHNTFPSLLTIELLQNAVHLNIWWNSRKEPKARHSGSWRGLSGRADAWLSLLGVAHSIALRLKFKAPGSCSSSQPLNSRAFYLQPFQNAATLKLGAAAVIGGGKVDCSKSD